MKLSDAEKILEISLTKDIKIDKEAALKIRDAKKKFVSHYKANPKSFIQKFIKILHGKTNTECDFILNPAQCKLVDALKENRWVAAPKARQLGITTLTNALALHHAIFASNANVICMAVLTANANENLRRIKSMFKTMPEWVQTLLIYSNEKDGHQNNVGLWSFKSKATNTNNKLEVATANAPDATRGKTPTFLHWTETAFSEYAEGLFTSILPALKRRKDSVIILESTGNGNAGFYYEVCVGIRKGFKVVFMPWHLDPDYTTGGDKLTPEDLEYIEDLMGVDRIPDFLSEDQLRWFQSVSEVIGKAKCQQEYPINVEQVFQATSTSFFSFKTIKKLKGGEVIKTLSFEDGYLTQRAIGFGQVFEAVRPDYEYIIGVDSSEGQNDPSVLTVLNPEGHEVLFWRELLLPDDLVKLIDVIGKQYNSARVAVESNGIGAYIINSLMSQYMYPNVFYDMGKPGIRTSVGNKAAMLAQLQAFILAGTLTFRNEHLALEMATFQADTLRAQKEATDDVVMASAIASHAFKVNKPLKRYVQEDFYDYTSQVYKERKQKRRFISGRRQWQKDTMTW